MTKEQIVKALRDCSEGRLCRRCHRKELTDLTSIHSRSDLLMIRAADVIEIQQREINAMRNELCQRCGRYKAAHEGACDGCRWKEEET